MLYTLEIAVFNAASAIAAEAAGADRIELCENPSDGGTTPSYGTLKLVRETVHIPVFPIIRPTGGDFLYDEHAYTIMQYDIQLCKDLGFEGVVLGLLHADGSIDGQRTSRLVELAWPMQVTFHRAFDRAANPLKALEQVINCGCKRILTSGQVPDAFEGRELIKALVQAAGSRIIIMPGSGVRSNNITALAAYTGVAELHSSARTMQPSAMDFIQAGMQESLMNISVDTSEVKKMKAALAASRS